MNSERAFCNGVLRFTSGLFLFVSMLGAASGQITVQESGDLLPDGSAYLMVEGESAYELNDLDPDEAEGFGWVIVDSDEPLESIAPIDGGFDILPEDTDASGNAAIMAELSGNGNTARWQVQFEHPGTYYLYTSWSAYNRDGNPDYLNEDSFYLPPDFNLNSRDDWFDFEGTDIFGDPKVGDSDRDGYIDGNTSLHVKVVDKGDVSDHHLTEDEFFEGQFSWFWLSEAIDMDETNTATGPNGHAIAYEVSEDEVGTVLDFEISSRESYTVIDAFLFSTRSDLLEIYSQEEMDNLFNDGGPPGLPGDFNSNGMRDPGDFDLLAVGVVAGDATFDLDGDGDADEEDRRVWIEELSNTHVGDSNWDGEFSSADFVTVFGAAKYETDAEATWSEGDWNGDKLFNSSDFVVAFSGAGYEQGPREGGLQVVPEPYSLSLLLFGLMAIVGRVRS